MLVAAIVVGAVLVAGLGLLAARLVVDRGRLLLQIETLSRRLEEATVIPSFEEVVRDGLPLGSPAPDFASRDLAGNQRELRDWHGASLLLLFLDPESGYSTEAMAALAREPHVPAIVAVACGDPAALGRAAREHGLACTVLVQGGEDLASEFYVPATPAGYLLDEEGRVARPRALGSDAILACAAGRGSVPTERVLPLDRSADPPVVVGRGLEPGTPAPAFSLPTLDGGRLRLDELRGKRFLLVFTDPDCEPCERLAPELARASGDVVVVSRGAPEANRAMVDRHAFRFQVALQRHWETSRLYGLLAAPAAYLIDEDGLVAAPAAVGEAAVRELIVPEKVVAGLRGT